MNGIDEKLARGFERALADSLARHWPGAPAFAHEAVARLARAMNEGHSGLALGDSATEDVAALRAWSAVAQGQADGDRPLVIDADHRLFLRRYWRYEHAVVEGVLTLARREFAIDDTVMSPVLATHVDAYQADEAQRDAIMRALRGGLTVIIGGPGTGKTWTVMRLLAALRALPEGDGARIAMAAATGKAAQRLNEGLARSNDTSLAAIKATTVHALLGLRRDSLETRYHAGAPLPAEVVVVDEAAMLDLPTMARLLAAIGPRARLILLGDPDQLASVEAGSVLAELRALASETPDHPVSRAVISLRRAHRFEHDGALAGALDAIRLGDFEGLSATIEGASGVFDWRRDVSPRTAREIAQGDVIATMRAGRDLPSRLAAIAQARVLVAPREGVYGVSAINAAVRELRGGRLNGEPVLITANARALDLANGDVGVMIERAGERQVAFDRGPERIDVLDEHELPEHEAAWAMTVHKAQGSEFEHVGVLLPEPAHALVTREWLYTAVSRARRRVSVWASVDALRAAIQRQAPRMSGLRSRLRELA